MSGEWRESSYWTYFTLGYVTFGYETNEPYEPDERTKKIQKRYIKNRKHFYNDVQSARIARQWDKVDTKLRKRKQKEDNEEF